MEDDLVAAVIKGNRVLVNDYFRKSDEADQGCNSRHVKLVAVVASAVGQHTIRDEIEDSCELDSDTVEYISAMNNLYQRSLDWKDRRIAGILLTRIINERIGSFAQIIINGVNDNDFNMNYLIPAAGVGLLQVFIRLAGANPNRAKLLEAIKLATLNGNVDIVRYAVDNFGVRKEDIIPEAIMSSNPAMFNYIKSGATFSIDDYITSIRVKNYSATDEILNQLTTMTKGTSPVSKDLAERTVARAAASRASELNDVDVISYLGSSYDLGDPTAYMEVAIANGAINVLRYFVDRARILPARNYNLNKIAAAALNTKNKRREIIKFLTDEGLVTWSTTY